MENIIPISRLYETISFTINMQYLCNLAEYHQQEIEKIHTWDGFFKLLFPRKKWCHQGSWNQAIVLQDWYSINRKWWT